MKLALSDTKPVYAFAAASIVLEDDRADQGVVTTDGHALLSYDVAQAIAKKLGLDFIPATFQARMKNAKGMWTVSLDLQPGTILLRKSQRKFEVDWDALLQLSSSDAATGMFEVVLEVSALLNAV